MKKQSITTSLVDQQFLTTLSGEYEIRSTKNSIQPYKAHSHRELSVGLIEKGSTCLSTVDVSKEIKRDNIVLIEPDLVHSCNPINGKPRSYHMIYLSEAWVGDLLGLKPNESIVVTNNVLNAANLASELIKCIAELRQTHSHNAHVSILTILKQIVLENCCSKDREQAHPLVTQVLSLLKIDDGEKAPSLKEISERLNYSEEFIIRAFNKSLGTSPKSFSVNERINYAKSLLREGKDIVEVAFSSGFADQSHFHKSFVKYTAATPLQYKTTDQF